MDLFEAVNHTARFISRSYYLVDEEDIVQELWVWLSAHPDKVVEWSAEEDEVRADAKLRLALKRAGWKFAKREQRHRKTLTGTGDGSGAPLWVEVPDLPNDLP